MDNPIVPAVAPQTPSSCAFDGCGRKVLALGLCTSHYRQQRRGRPLKALRKFRGLKRLPMVLRVEQKTLEALQSRVAAGKAKSMYEATRQALEAGIAALAEEKDTQH